MNYLDLILLLPLAYGIYRGFTKGLIIELSSLIGIVAGVYGAFHFSYLVSDFLIDKFQVTWDYLPIVSFILTFFIIVIIVYFIAKLIDHLIEAIALGFINRILGIVFGILKVTLVTSILLVLFDKLDENDKIIPEKTKTESILYYPLRNVFPAIFPYFNFEEINLDLEKNKESALDAIKI